MIVGLFAIILPNSRVFLPDSKTQYFFVIVNLHLPYKNVLFTKKLKL